MKYDCDNHKDFIDSHTCSLGDQDGTLRCGCGRTFGKIEHYEWHVKILWDREHDECRSHSVFKGAL